MILNGHFGDIDPPGYNHFPSGNCKQVKKIIKIYFKLDKPESQLFLQRRR